MPSTARVDRGAGPIRTSAVVCATPDSPIASALAERFDPDVVVVAHDRQDLLRAAATVHAASLVAVTSGGRAPTSLLSFARSTWPMAPRFWFERWSRPELPVDGPSLHPTILLGPYHDGMDGLASRLAEEIEHGRAERDRQTAVGLRYARAHRLPELATRLVVGISLGVAPVRLHTLLEQDPDRFRQYCSRTVYPRAGVASIPELQTSVWAFERSERTLASAAE